MIHQLEISFEYDDEPVDDVARPKLDLLAGLSNVKDVAQRNLRERNAYISVRRAGKQSHESLSQRLTRRLD